MYVFSNETFDRCIMHIVIGRLLFRAYFVHQEICDFICYRLYLLKHEDLNMIEDKNE